MRELIKPKDQKNYENLEEEVVEAYCQDNSCGSQTCPLFYSTDSDSDGIVF